MPNTNPPIILLPGLGANFRLFTPQLAAFPTTIVPAWPASDANTKANAKTRPAAPIDREAERLAVTLEREGRLNAPPVLVGFSFGGQIALSLARAAIHDRAQRPAAVVLISAPRTTDQLNASFHRRAVLTAACPAPFIRPVARFILAPAFARTLRLPREHAAQVNAMARELDPRELKHHARLARAWNFTDQDHRKLRSAGIPVHHIHASADPVIPPPPTTTPQLTILNERAHLLTLTHTNTVNAVIERAIAALQANPNRQPTPTN
mgnify:FL=1